MIADRAIQHRTLNVLDLQRGAWPGHQQQLHSTIWPFSRHLRRIYPARDRYQRVARTLRRGWRPEQPRRSYAAHVGRLRNLQANTHRRDAVHLHANATGRNRDARPRIRSAGRKRLRRLSAMGLGSTNLPAPVNVPSLGANVFSGTQIAPAFIGDGSGLTNLPRPAARRVTWCQYLRRHADDRWRQR